MQGLLDHGQWAERHGRRFELCEPVVGAESMHGPHQCGAVGPHPGFVVAQRAERDVGPFGQRLPGDTLGDASAAQSQAQLLFKLLFVHSQYCNSRRLDIEIDEFKVSVICYLWLSFAETAEI
jgi:hypothetical protein